MSIKFVIVAAARTGSTLLVRTLNSLDSVCCHGELLNIPVVRSFSDGFDPEHATQAERGQRGARLLQQRDEDPVGFIQAALSSDNAATGFKALYGALLNPHWRAVTDSLLATPDIKFIHLVRRNQLRRFVSEKILRAGGPNHSGAGGRSEQRVKVHIDVADFLHNCREVERERDEILALLAGRDILEAAYEDLAADTGSMVSEICRFLRMDIAPATVNPALRKVGAADLSESVSNFQELMDHQATRAMALGE